MFEAIGTPGQAGDTDLGGVGGIRAVNGGVGIASMIVLATVPYLEPAGFIGLRGNGLTTSKIDDFLSELPN
jgi:hypothetical protein